ncbi:MAG: hypothetical protein ACLQMF_16005 [Rectinemataceae bacterium]
MTGSRAIAWFAVASLAVAIPLRARAQDLPESLRDRAMSIQIQAVIISPGANKDGSPALEQSSWHEEGAGLTVPGTPVGIKLVASNMVIFVQVTPFDREGGHLTLVVQGEVWLRKDDGGLSFRTTVDKVDVAYGETVFFYPLGAAPKGKPSLRVAISVTKAGAAASGTAGTSAVGTNAASANGTGANAAAANPAGTSTTGANATGTNAAGANPAGAAPQGQGVPAGALPGAENKSK